MAQEKCRLSLMVAAAGVAVGLVGCDNQVDTYAVPKEPEPAAERGTATGQPVAGEHGSGAHVHWELPQGWQEKSAGQFRAASFAVSSDSAPEADVAIIPLPTHMGKELQFVNLWRQQVQLSPITQEQLETEAEVVTVGDTEGRMFNFTSEEPLIDEQHPAQILVAMAPKGQTTWFVKMTGPASVVSAEEEAFKKFLESLDLHGEAASAMAGSAGAPHPVAQETPNRGGGSAAGTANGAGEAQWEKPEAWEVKSPGRMLLATFGVSSDGGEAEVTVSAFPGDVGGLTANVNRWRRQLGLEPAAEEALSDSISSVTLPAGEAKLVDLTGTSAAGEQRMLTAVLSHKGKTWFFKIMGDAEVVEANKEQFMEFIHSVRYPNG